jgi:hypothetical protein
MNVYVTGTHDEAKAFLQKQYFYMDTPDLSIPLFAFVGRVTQQKVSGGLLCSLLGALTPMNHLKFECVLGLKGLVLPRQGVPATSPWRANVALAASPVLFGLAAITVAKSK